MHKQRGVTMIGWIILLIPIAIVLYAGLRVGPEYFNYYKLRTAMEETATKLRSDETLTPKTIRSALDRRFNTGYIDMKSSDLEVTKVDGGWQMAADYESEVKLFGNLYLTMAFDHTTIIANN
ncbi:MAG TPA: DUF4845 domain-containing protein [Steroidobacteraceae bacterium]|nr:DUF4845 domain-containing protein [Steroidobacteraceae bacterium]